MLTSKERRDATANGPREVEPTKHLGELETQNIPSSRVAKLFKAFVQRHPPLVFFFSATWTARFTPATLQMMKEDKTACTLKGAKQVV